MRKYPFVRQNGLKDCGPACTLMILKYYNGYVNIDKLSELLSSDRNGTTAYHIVVVLNSLGFISNGFKYDNISFIKCPSIVHMKTDSYFHYSVVWNINYKKKKILLGDPSRGNILISFDEFLSFWTGYVIEAFPNREVVKEKEVGVYSFLYKLIKPKVKCLFICSLLSFLLSILSIVLSFFIQGVLTYIEKTDLLIKVFIIFSIMFLLKLIIGHIRNYLLIKLDLYFDKKLSLDTFNNIISLPYLLHERKTTGEIVSYFNDLSLIKSFITKFFVSLFIDIPVSLILSLYLLFISFHLFSLSMFIFCLFFIIHIVYKNKFYYYTSEVLRSKAMVNSFITESVSGISTIRNVNLENKVLERFRFKYNNFSRLYYKMEKLSMNELFFKDFVSNLSLIITVVYGIYSIKNGLSYEIFITLYFLLNLLVSSFRNLFNFNYDFAQVKSAISHIGNMNVIKKDDKKVLGNIVIENLSFSFDRLNNVLSDINIVINSSSKVIVSGESGSGKSTLFKIVKGYYDNFKGSVKIGKCEVSKYHLTNVLYVSSKETLFTGCVYDDLNISDLSNKDICETDFINDNMFIEEDGFNLSDGQKQRISLARALNDFDILIIDEALCDVDVNMERRVLKSILGKYSDKTVIFISHRLDNIDLFDRFIKLYKGRVVLDEVRV